ncbi:MAG: S26 family signal peptidase [Thermoplasmata archaeon]
MTETEDDLLQLGKDVIVSLIILVIILGSLYAFAGRWPPMVVVESGSMMHSDDSQVGVIDPADIVLVQETEKEEITTYVEGRSTGYKKYGQYGDVIIFEPDGDQRKTPIIHRAVVYLEYDEVNSSFEIPSLGDLEYGEEWITSQGETTRGLTDSITIFDYGYADVDLTIDLSELHGSGFITMGDSEKTNAPTYDQKGPGGDDLVQNEWIKGRARGELPWFGIIKLTFMGRTDDIPSNSWINFGVSIGVILLLPIIAEFGVKMYEDFSDKKSEDREKTSPDETDEPPNDKEIGEEKTPTGSSSAEDASEDIE